MPPKSKKSGKKKKSKIGKKDKPIIASDDKLPPVTNPHTATLIATIVTNDTRYCKLFIIFVNYL